MKRNTSGLLALAVFSAVGVWCGPVAAETVDFEDVGAGLAAEKYWNGSDGTGGFSSGQLGFNNAYDVNYDVWVGWSYSNTTDTVTPEFTNQYSAYPGGGADGSPTYGVAYSGFTGNPEIAIPAGYHVASAMVTNTTFAVLSMRNGDSYAKKFGGTSGDDPDWFLLTILGKNSSGQEIGSQELYLADYRDANNVNDYILDEWTTLDLSSLQGASKLEFSMTSSDVGQWGMNTPAYFAMDNIVVQQVPEPSTLAMLLSAAAALLLVRRRRC